MDLPAAILKTYPPSKDRLLEQVNPAIDNAMLREIAMADNGYKWEAMYEMLRLIRDRKQFPQPIDFDLREVLSLTRWSDPDAPNQPPFPPGPSGITGHWIRFYACALLFFDHEDPCDSYDSSLAIALGSSRWLGEDVNVALLRFLTHRYDEWDYVHQQSYTLLGILMLLLRYPGEKVKEGDLEALADQLLDRDKTQVDFDWNDLRPDALSIQQGFWKPTIAELTQQSEKVGSERLKEKLLLCSLIVSGG